MIVELQKKQKGEPIWRTERKINSIQTTSI
jgi:hypothetical protein